MKFLRCQKGKYRKRYGTRIREKQRDEAKKKRIDTRPAVVETKERIGDYEGDTIVGSDKNHILTHNERKSGMLFACKLETPTAEETRKATVSLFKKYQKRKSIPSLTTTESHSPLIHRRKKTRELIFTSLIRITRGKGGAMKTPTACFVSIFQKGRRLGKCVRKN